MDDHGSGTVSPCSQCGKDLMPGKAFCRHCGAPVLPAPRAAPAAVTACPRCAEPLMAGEPFCPNCGLRVIPLSDQPPMPPGQAPIPSVESRETPVPEAMRRAALESAPAVPTVVQRPEQPPRPVAALTQDALPPFQAVGDATDGEVPSDEAANVPADSAPAAAAPAPEAGASHGDERVESEPPIAATLVAPGLVPLEDATPDVATNGAGMTAPNEMEVDRVAEPVAAAWDDSPTAAIEAGSAAPMSLRSEPPAATAGDEAPATQSLQQGEAAAEERSQSLDGWQPAPGGAEAVPPLSAQQWGVGPTPTPPYAPQQNTPAPPYAPQPNTPPYAPQQNTLPHVPQQHATAQNTPPPYVPQQSAPAPRPITPGKYCVNCGAGIDVRAEICPRCGVRQPGMAPVSPTIVYNNGKSKIAAGLLAFFLGGLGIHKFYLGQTGLGVTYLICSIVSGFLCIVLIGFFFLFVIWVVCLIECIMYLTMSDEAFAAKYDQPRTMVTY